MNTLIILSAALFSRHITVAIHLEERPPEPTSQLIKAVLWGMAICFPVALLELLIQTLLINAGVDSSTLAGTTIKAFVVAALPEEAFKLLGLWLVLRKNPYFDEHFDGIVYAVCIGLGFAALENVLYVFSEENWPSVAIARALLAVPGHYAFAVLMGYYYSVYHFAERSPKIAACILLAPVVAHGIYDALALSGTVNPYIGGLSFFILIWFCVKMHKRAKKKIVALIEKDKNFYNSDYNKTY